MRVQVLESTITGYVSIYTRRMSLYVNVYMYTLLNVQFGRNLPSKYGSVFGSVFDFDGIPWILEYQK